MFWKTQIRRSFKAPVTETTWKKLRRRKRIADYEQNVLVQIKQSLLEELQKHGTLDTHIHQGDLLALDQNKQGQIIALKQLTHEAEKCKA